MQNKRINIDLDKLVLDAKNPRLSITIKAKNETLEEQFLRTIKPEQIMSLMKSLLNEMSFNLSNIFSVIKNKNDKYIVLDGNRRTLAVMILASRSNIKNQEINKFKIANKKRIDLFLNQNKRILCAVYETREEAMKWIDMNHLFSEKGVSTLPWNTFARRIASGNIFANEFKRILDESNIEIKKFKIRYTIFERIFDDKDVKKYFNITKKNNSLTIGDESNFLDFVKYLDTMKYNLQDVYDKDDKITTLNKFKNYKNKEMNNILKNWDLTPKEVDIDNIKKTKPKKVKIFENSIPYITNDKIKRIANQIQKISLNQYKELVAISIRPLIDMTCNEYLTRVLKKTKTWFDKRENTLKDRINLVYDEIKKTGIKKENISTMSYVMRDLDKFLLALNGNIHDVRFISLKSELEEYLKRVTIFLEEVWRKIS